MQRQLEMYFKVYLLRARSLVHGMDKSAFRAIASAGETVCVLGKSPATAAVLLLPALAHAEAEYLKLQHPHLI